MFEDGDLFCGKLRRGLSLIFSVVIERLQHCAGSRSRTATFDCSIVCNAECGIVRKSSSARSSLRRRSKDLACNVQRLEMIDPVCTVELQGAIRMSLEMIRETQWE